MEQQQLEENKGTTSGSGDKKRARDDDSDCDSPESKLTRVASANSDLYSSPVDVDSRDAGVDSENSGVSSPEAKRIQDELLSVLDDLDEPPIQGLDSVIKSFEEEILVPAQAEVTSFSGVSQPDLGYLLEASDDELGLPPTFSTEDISGAAEQGGTGGTATGFGDIFGGFENELPVGYDSFELGLGEGESNRSNSNKNYNDGEGFVALGGLFDYSEESFVSADISGMQWQAESLPAL